MVRDAGSAKVVGRCFLQLEVNIISHLLSTAPRIIDRKERSHLLFVLVQTVKHRRSNNPPPGKHKVSHINLAQPFCVHLSQKRRKKGATVAKQFTAIVFNGF